MKQLGLFDTVKEPRLVREFRLFHADNPRVYELFCRFTQEVIEAGRTRYSADAILHRIRWHVDIEIRSGDGLKINDHFSAFYSRRWALDHPTQPDLFERRRSVADAVTL